MLSLRNGLLQISHLGIVAEVCRVIGVAEWREAQDPASRQHVSVGTATVSMVLNGLGFSNRQLYLVPQSVEDKPVEHLLGSGITAGDLNDDCLGADAGLIVRPRCDDAVCWFGVAGTVSVLGALVVFSCSGTDA